MSDVDSRRGWSSALLLGFVLAAVAGLGILGAMSPSIDGGEPPGPISPALEDSVPYLPAMARDIRVRAIMEGYGPLIDSVVYLEDDVVFLVAGSPVYFQDGRMLSRAALHRARDFDPVFYSYSREPLSRSPPFRSEPTYSRDFLEHLFGGTEEEIRKHGVSADFLDHKVFVNAYCLEPLQAVEEDIRKAALSDPEVADWVRDIKIAYSFIDKNVAGSRGRSHHAWGMAIDLVPSSYGGKQVYWRWSRVFNRETWSRIPVEERWSPPQAVIEAFEGHGFVWGGKWLRFDNIHFEYRPEILAYNRMMRQMLP